LEAGTGLRFATLQQIAAGEVNATTTSIVTIVETLHLSLGQFFSYYDNISEKEVLDHKAALKKAKDERRNKNQKKEAKKKARSD
jgi:transcriptional regulator with XRE-family HTH domain